MLVIEDKDSSAERIQGQHERITAANLVTELRRLVHGRPDEYYSPRSKFRKLDTEKYSKKEYAIVIRKSMKQVFTESKRRWQ